LCVASCVCDETITPNHSAGGRNLVLETMQDRSVEEQKQLTHAWAHGLAYAIHKAKGFRILVV
jgi:hypothetical protein